MEASWDGFTAALKTPDHLKRTVDMDSLHFHISSNRTRLTPLTLSLSKLSLLPVFIHKTEGQQIKIDGILGFRLALGWRNCIRFATLP